MFNCDDPENLKGAKRTKKYMQWAMHQSMSMSTICIASYTSGASLKKWLPKAGASVTRIIFVGEVSRPRPAKETERAVIRYCTNVTSVVCSYQFDADLYGKIAKAWPKLQSLTPGFSPNDACVAAFCAHCTRLTSLDVSELHFRNIDAAVSLIKANGPTLLSFCGGIAVFDTDDKIPLAVALYCPNLCILNCDAKFAHADSTLSALLQGCPLLQEIYLKDSWLAQESCEALASSLGSHLLSLHNCGTLCGRPNAVRSFARHCPNLRSLWMYSMPGQITDDIAELLAQHCTGLEKLDLGHCNASPHAILTIAAACPRLRMFNMNFKVLKEADLIAVMTSCPHLPHLKVDFCNAVTDRSLQLLPQLCPHITHLWLDYCTFGEEIMILIAERCRKLQYLKVPTEYSRYIDYMIEDSGLFRPRLVEKEGDEMLCAVM